MRVGVSQGDSFTEAPPLVVVPPALPTTDTDPAATQSFEERRLALLKRAREERAAWVEQGLQSPPPHLSKESVAASIERAASRSRRNLRSRGSSAAGPTVPVGSTQHLSYRSAAVSQDGDDDEDGDGDSKPSGSSPVTDPLAAPRAGGGAGTSTSLASHFSLAPSVLSALTLLEGVAKRAAAAPALPCVTSVDGLTAVSRPSSSSSSSRSRPSSPQARSRQSQGRVGAGVTMAVPSPAPWQTLLGDDSSETREGIARFAASLFAATGGGKPSGPTTSATNGNNNNTDSPDFETPFLTHSTVDSPLLDSPSMDGFALPSPVAHAAVGGASTTVKLRPFSSAAVSSSPLRASVQPTEPTPHTADGDGDGVDNGRASAHGGSTSMTRTPGLGPSPQASPLRRRELSNGHVHAVAGGSSAVVATDSPSTTRRSSSSSASTSAGVAATSTTAASPPPVPPSPVDSFVERLKQPRAADVVENIRTFVTSIQRMNVEADSRLAEQSGSVDDDSDTEIAFSGGARGRGKPTTPPEMVRSFLTRMEDALRAHPLWKNDSADAWEDTVEALERFVISKIYDKVVSDVDFWLWAVGCGL